MVTLKQNRKRRKIKHNNGKMFDLFLKTKTKVK